MGKNRLCLALWLLIAAVLCFFENNAGTTAVLAASVLLPVVSCLCARHTAAKASVTLTAPEECAQGQPAAVQVRLTAPWTQVFCCVSAAPTARNAMTGSTRPLRQTGPGAYTLDTGLCGTTEVSVPRIAATDWFGISAFAHAPDCAAEVIVVPEPYPVTLVSAPVTGPSESAALLSRAGGGLDETLSVRPYLPGDPVRLIHWKLSDKLDRTMLRETGVLQSEQVLLLLDARRHAAASDADVCACVTGLLSVARALAQEGTAFRVCLPGHGEPQLTTIERPEDLPHVTQAVLRADFTRERESIGSVFAARYASLLAGRIALFSPSADTDAASLYAGRRVTLALPPACWGASGTGEIAVCILGPEGAELEL